MTRRKQSAASISPLRQQHDAQTKARLDEMRIHLQRPTIARGCFVRFSELLENIAQIVQRAGKTRLQLQHPAEILNRFIISPLIFANVCQAGISFGIIRLSLDRLAKATRSIIRSCLASEGSSQVVQRVRVTGPRCKSASCVRLGPRNISTAHQNHGQVVVRTGVVRVQLDHPTIQLGGHIGLANFLESNAQVVMRLSECRPGLDRA